MGIGEYKKIVKDMILQLRYIKNTVDWELEKQC